MALGEHKLAAIGVRVVGLLVLLAIIAPFVVYAVPQTIGADQSYIVLSGSMEPVMSPGDAVVVRNAPADAIQEQDIITFQREASSTPTTHRVIDIEQQDGQRAFITQGDANEDPDPGAIAPSQVIGEVVLVIPVMGQFVQFANTPLGLLLLVGLPVGLLVVSEVWSFARTTDRSATATQHSDTTETTTATTNGIQLTPSSLQLVIVVLGFYLAYTWYIAWTVRTGISIGTATATTVAFLYGTVLYGQQYGLSQVLSADNHGSPSGTDDRDGRNEPEGERS